MPPLIGKAAATVTAFLLFIMFIAGMSTFLKTKESPALIRNASTFLSNLFKGVFK